MGVVAFPSAPPVAPWEAFEAARRDMLQAFATALSGNLPVETVAMIPLEIEATCNVMNALIAFRGSSHA